jgi:hypothetical protein
LTVQERHELVFYARRTSPGKAAKKFGVALSTAQYWLHRADAQRRLDRVDFKSRPTGRRRAANRTAQNTEEQVLQLRQELKNSDLGEYGAVAIYAAMTAAKKNPAPAVATISRILRRHDVIAPRKRQRYPSPEKGWYLPLTDPALIELDQFDFIEQLKIEHREMFHVLNGISWHSNLRVSAPMLQMSAENVINCLLSLWRRFGLPDYAQFDNGSTFTGGERSPNTRGSVTRFCLQLGVIPIFAPPATLGYQSTVERYNGEWQAKVWRHQHYAAFADVENRSLRYVEAQLKKHHVGAELSPLRRAFPANWEMPWQAPPRGLVIFLRELKDDGSVRILGRRYAVSANYAHTKVRVELDLTKEQISFFSIHRRQPYQSELLHSEPRHFPVRKFVNFATKKQVSPKG